MPGTPALGPGGAVHGHASSHRALRSSPLSTYTLLTPSYPPFLSRTPLQVRFVVMNNIFRTDAELHRKYDLKGSTLGRTAGPCPAGGGEWSRGVGVLGCGRR